MREHLHVLGREPLRGFQMLERRLVALQAVEQHPEVVVRLHVRGVHGENAEVQLDRLLDAPVLHQVLRSGERLTGGTHGGGVVPRHLGRLANRGRDGALGRGAVRPRRAPGSARGSRRPAAFAHRSGGRSGVAAGSRPVPFPPGCASSAAAPRSGSSAAFASDAGPPSTVGPQGSSTAASSSPCSGSDSRLLRFFLRFLPIRPPRPPRREPRRGTARDPMLPRARRPREGRRNAAPATAPEAIRERAPSSS